MQMEGGTERHFALIRQGYESNFNGNLSSVFFQNANLSVRVTDEFMRAVRQSNLDDQLSAIKATSPPPRTGGNCSKMAECAWHCGDPGVQYDSPSIDGIPANSGRINASNPCSEYMFLDNTACNLASINLMKFRREDGTFDVERLRPRPSVLHRQEISVDHASYPTAQIAENSHRYRPLGVGLFQPRQPDHDGRLGLRFRRGSFDVRFDHRTAAWRRQSGQR